jgi:hypothetical protein
MFKQWGAVLSRPWCIWVMSGIILVAGAYIRLVGLNDTSLHGDGIIHDVCKAGVSPVDILTKWEGLVGQTAQLATPAAFTKWLLDVFHLVPTRGNVILPTALWGIVTLPAALWVGWMLGGRWFGLLLMSVVAFNPMHVQMSRVAYFYPPSILGSFLMAGCLLVAWENMKAGRRLGWAFFAVHGTAVVLLLYSSANAWLLTGCFAATLVLLSIIKARRKQVSLMEASAIASTYVVLGLPLLFFSWGVPALVALTQESAQVAYGRRIFAVDRAKPVLDVVLQEFSRLGWGWTTLRGTIGAGIFVVGGGIVALRARRDMKWGFPLVAFCFGLLVAVMAIRTSGLPFGLRRVAAIWPFAFIVLSAGLAWPWLVDIAAYWRAPIRLGWIWVIAVLLGLWVSADLMALQCNGFPIPYRQIGQWMDSHFPKGTPVVTDRFYTAMCEFNQSDPTTNVVVLSTVMNELPEIQEKTRFREVTRQYFEENPDAVFYCSGHMYERPEIVPWEWPTRYFKQSKEIKDGMAEALGVVGQSFHMGYPGRQRWPVIYYNTVEDVAAIKRGAGSSGFVLWGPDWRPVQTQDYRLWRLLMAGDADLKVYGLGATEEEVALELMGVAAGGELRVQIGDQGLVFPANQIAQQRVKIKLQPGMNVVKIRSRGAQNARLLIGKAEVKKGI